MEQRGYLQGVQDEWRFVGFSPLSSVQVRGKGRRSTRFGQGI
jgi:hypothetical protein